MITHPTVFVLGAGASMPYGFPSGTVLGRDITSRLQSANGELAIVLRSNGADANLVQSFPREFRQSGRDSIDAFLESRREFALAVRMAIVVEIGNREIEAALFPKNADNDWMGYLFNRMLGGSPTDFARNKLKVITFNFDRSFERRLFLTVSANYNLGDAEALKLCQDVVPILHVHGDLGTLSWGNAAHEVHGRAYEPFSQQTLETNLAGFADRIKIIHDEIPKDTINLARQWLKEASRVCFIGFGYHVLNLKRLKVAALSDPARHDVAGTFVGFEQGEIASVKLSFGSNIAVYSRDARSFLRHTKYVHD